MKLPILNLESRIPGYSSDDSISPEFKAFLLLALIHLAIILIIVLIIKATSRSKLIETISDQSNKKLFEVFKKGSKYKIMDYTQNELVIKNFNSKEDFKAYINFNLEKRKNKEFNDSNK